MKLMPNLNKPLRVTYLIVGLALIVAPFVVALPAWGRIPLPILGLMSIFTGATGW